MTVFNVITPIYQTEVILERTFKLVEHHIFTHFKCCCVKDDTNYMKALTFNINHGQKNNQLNCLLNLNKVGVNTKQCRVMQSSTLSLASKSRIS